MATHIIFDVETVAHPRASEWLDPVKPDARLKDPEKIKADIEEKTAERAARFALDPECNTICALGYYVVGHDEPHCLLCRDEFEEREMIRQFFDVYREHDRRSDVRLVTFNGIAFDLPTLNTRGRDLDLDTPYINDDKYRSPHAEFDLMWWLCGKGARPPKSLKFYARKYGFGTLDKVNGSNIAQLVKDEDWNAVEAHCLSDIGLTHALANRLKRLPVR